MSEPKTSAAVKSGLAHDIGVDIRSCCFKCFVTVSESLLEASQASGAKVVRPRPKPLTTFDGWSLKFPLFVTWTHTESGDLRGCIGTFAPLELHLGLHEYSLAAAFRDGRFSPIGAAELETLSVGVSLLVKFERAKNYRDWTIGTHGIWIEFKSDFDGRKQTATYLPEVAHEQGWNHVKTIDSLLRKGGFRSKITEAVRRSVIVTRYQSVKHKASHAEYLEWVTSGVDGSE